MRRCLTLKKESPIKRDTTILDGGPLTRPDATWMLLLVVVSMCFLLVLVPVPRIYLSAAGHCFPGLEYNLCLADLIVNQ